MELRHTHRLHLDLPLSEGVNVDVDADQAHYLQHVLRMKTGDVLRLFNSQDGEWKASVANLSKRSVTLKVEQQTRPMKVEPDLWLCAAPIKKAHFEYMIEKATELGISVFQPVLTARTQIREVNLDRARTIATEAAEQSDRLTIPEFRPPLSLEKLLSSWPASRQLIVCAEWGEATPIQTTLKSASSSHAAILTGPEGGLSGDELTLLRTIHQAAFTRLGPRILRADTAAIAALSNWQAQCGDWQT